MGWFSNISDGLNDPFADVPKWFHTLTLSLVWLALCLLGVAIAGKYTHAFIVDMLPVTTEDVAAAERRVLLEKRLVEANEASMVAFDRTNVQRQMDETNVDAHRTSLGLKPKRSTDGLQAFAEVATAHLSTITVVAFLVYLVPIFATTRDPWRLSFIISAIVVLSGLFAIIGNVASDTNVTVALSMSGSKGKPSAVPIGEFFATISSGSVGFYLMGFGTLLAGFSHYILRKHDNKTAKGESKS
jgi:hypothetical protein